MKFCDHSLTAKIAGNIDNTDNTSILCYEISLFGTIYSGYNEPIIGSK